jgi:hypothetical protein
MTRVNSRARTGLALEHNHVRDALRGNAVLAATRHQHLRKLLGAHRLQVLVRGYPCVRTPRTQRSQHRQLSEEDGSRARERRGPPDDAKRRTHQLKCEDA